jgi:hypothetical protein
MLFLLVFITLEPLVAVSLGTVQTCHAHCPIETQQPHSPQPHSDSSTSPSEVCSNKDHSDSLSQLCNPLTSCSCCSILPVVIHWKSLQNLEEQDLISFAEPLSIAGKNFKNLWQPPQLR